MSGQNLNVEVRMCTYHTLNEFYALLKLFKLDEDKKVIEKKIQSLRLALQRHRGRYSSYNKHLHM